MSKAFVKDDGEGVPEDDPIPARPAQPLPLTAEGRAALEAALRALDADAAKGRRGRLLRSILDTTVVEPTALQANGGAGFGCTVVFETEDGARRRYRLVGPDEADPNAGRVSITSPLARAVLGQRPGAVVVWKKPAGDEELTVISVSADVETEVDVDAD